MKKRGYIGRLGALAVVLCLVTMSLTSGTLAKYASSTEGAAAAVVAKWDIALKGNGEEYTDSTEITLKPDVTTFVTPKLVKDGVVAPEAWGKVEFEIDGSKTEVAFDYAIELNLGGITPTGTTTACPLMFYKSSTFTDENKLTGENNKVTLKNEQPVLVDATPDNQKATMTIYWKWNSTDDAGDTALGKEAATVTGGVSYKIPVTITATQHVATT